MTGRALSGVLRQARGAIGADGQLPYQERRRIWQVFIDELGPADGPRAWSAVEAGCARHAWPIWQEKFPREDQPMATLVAAEQAAASGVPGGVAVEIGSLKSFLDGKFILGPSYFAAIYAGFAAHAAAADALYRLGPPSGDEFEVDPDEWEASFYASLAFAGGAIWEEGVGDPEARRAFWLWFLDVPVTQFGAGPS